MSAGALEAKACRSGSLMPGCLGLGSNEAGARRRLEPPAHGDLSFLLPLFETGLLTMAEAISRRAAGTLSRPRMLVAAAPTTRKQVSAMMVMALVKQLSVSVNEPRPLCPENWALIKA